MPIHNVPVTLRTDKTVKRVYLAPQNIDIPFEQQGDLVTYVVPEVECHQMICIE